MPAEAGGLSAGRPLRVGVVHYLNAWPLAWAFLDGEAPPGWQVRLLAPSAVADGLADGSLDVGLVPSAELQRIPGLEVVPGLAIASTHEVRSVLLISRVAPERIRRVALDTSSRTSAVLVQLLLAERWGVRPEVALAAPDLEAMLAGADAALLIGDPALAVDRSRYRVVDLAAEWRALTGLPFVFAVWAARRPLAAAETEVFAASLRRGRAELDRIAARAERRLGVAAEAARRYLTENLSYELGEAERASLAEFFRRGHLLGLLPEPRPLVFAGEPAAAATG